MRRVSRQLTVVLLAAGIIFLPHISFAAGVQITEIMYSPSGTDSGHEWVEVHNRSGREIVLSDWNLRENETDHRINTDGSQTLPDGEYAVIADDPQKAKNKYSQITAPVFDSTFSLNNSGESIAIIRPDGSVADSVQYDPSIGADGDGNSLQLSDNYWIAAGPTPQSVNAEEESTDDSGGSDTNGDTDTQRGASTRILQPRSDDSDTQTDEQDTEKTQKIRVDAGNDMHAIAGVQVHLEGVATTTGIDEAHNAEIFWSLGNGDTKQSSDIFYTYQHPGKYVATLVYRSDKYNEADQVTVRVASPDLHITDRETGPDGYTKIANDLNRDVNLSGWHLRSGTDTKTLPDYTIALANSTLTLDNQATGLTNGSVQLLYPDATIADTFKPNQPTSTQAATNTQQADASNEDTSQLDDSSAVTTSETNSDEPQTTSSEQSLEALFATDSQAAAAGQAGSSSGFWRWGILASVIIIGGAVLVAVVSQFSENREQDLLSSTFDITEM